MMPAGQIGQQFIGALKVGYRQDPAGRRPFRQVAVAHVGDIKFGASDEAGDHFVVVFVAGEGQEDGIMARLFAEPAQIFGDHIDFVGPAGQFESVVLRMDATADQQDQD